jgi:acyl dehydratase
LPTQLVEPLTIEQIDALPLFEWDDARAGDAAPPFTYRVTAESIADYCAAVRNANPLYLDAAAAARGPFGGIIAPPTFAFKCAPLRRNEVMHARGFASPEEKGDRATPYAKSRLWFERPIRVGDEITSVVRLAEKYERRGSQFITWTCEAHDGHGQPVVRYEYTTIWRRAPAEASPAREATDVVPAASPPPSVGDALPSLIKIETQEAIDRYSELTRVRPRVGNNNLHSNPEFARQTIFGGTVNMGVATAAYCAEVLENAFGPVAVLSRGATLEYKGIRPIRADFRVTIGGQVVVRTADRAECELSVHNHDGLLCGVGSATVVLG